MHSKSFTTLSGRSSSFQFVLLRRPYRVSASFLSTDIAQISLLRSGLYPEITQVPSLGELLGSSKKYTIIFVYVTSYANTPKSTNIPVFPFSTVSLVPQPVAAIIIFPK
ncbi:conserved hypothetical protein [Trichinella spiralis]|uniref:hypothetical protein n=1 Tax=Trichinella spiralis TaxID=6334 RepID=UPI0001EFED81|nr:conserved hypothetical protein [Trichinella spiralis]